MTFRFLPLLLTVLTVGCGSTNSRTATEQLLASDAVEAAVSQVDFRPLKGQRVFFDTSYIENYKGIGFVNAEYVISSLRQQIVAAGCLLQDTKEAADFIIEGRIGALGTDSHDIIYGLPANNILSAAASVVPGAPPLPTIPEISLARKNDQQAAAKVALFAYHRETKARVWQSGTAIARSTAKDTWFFGAGPFQSGTLHDGVQFAGNEISLLANEEDEPDHMKLSKFREPALFNPPDVFENPHQITDEASPDAGHVVPASAEVQSEATGE